MARFKLTDVGRAKFCGEVKAATEMGLLRQIGKHLMSRDISIAEDGTIYVGGFRPVGKVEPIEKESA